MEVKIIEQQSILIVGMAIRTLLSDVGETEPTLHAEFKSRLPEIGNRIEPFLDYAVSIDPPDYNDDTDKFKLVIGVAVDHLAQIPHGMELFEAAGTYASVMKEDDSTFGALIRWVNDSDYELSDIYSIEVHDHLNSFTTLMFPIVKKVHNQN